VLSVRGVLRVGLKVPDAGKGMNGEVGETGLVREGVWVEMGRMRWS
jgi:hypothetical protein